MAKYCDPIAYCFSFRTVTTQAVEEDIKAAFKSLLLSLKEYILRYGGYEDRISGQGLWYSYDKFIETPESVPPADKLIFATEYTLDQASEIFDAELERFMKYRYYGLNIDGDQRPVMRHFAERPTPLAKEYLEWLAKPKKPIDFKNNQKHIYELFSCPSDGLLDVLTPISIATTEKLCEIDCRSWPVNDDFILSITEEKIITTINENERHLPHYLHEISISIPRFLIGKTTDTKELQRNWTDHLIKLGNQYPTSTGVIYMDIPKIFRWLSTCYDYEALVDLKKRYITDRIPGYAWGMLVNADQAKRLGKMEESDKDLFYRKTDLKNGSIFFQKTPDVRIMSMKDCRDCRLYFTNSLPDVNLFFRPDMLPPSLRLGFSEEEMVFENLHIFTQFEVEHHSDHHC